MAELRDELWRRSTRYQLDNIHTPMFVVQGWNDGLFQAEELIDVYQNLRERGVAAFLYLGGMGHPPAEGDTSDPPCCLPTRVVRVNCADVDTVEALQRLGELLDERRHRFDIVIIGVPLSSFRGSSSEQRATWTRSLWWTRAC